MDEPQLLKIKDRTFRLRTNQAEPCRLLILIHGWMGDENSMWVLVRKLPPNYLVLAPRAPFPVEEGGFSWRKIGPGTWGTPSLGDLQPSADALLAFVDEWSASAGINSAQFDLMGFSQGVAMAYVITLLYPERVRQLAALSGFFPEGGESLLSAHTVFKKPIFIAHGRQDELISVEYARRSAALLSGVGAQIYYCESDTGHKVGKECLRELEKFFGNY
jgi:phospholipase/carboxylesterase